MKKKHRRVLARIIASAAATAVLLVLPPEGILGALAWLSVYALIGYDIVIKAAYGLFCGRLLDESFLMALATIGAIIIAVWGRGDFLEAVAVMLFYQTGELLSALAVEKSRKDIGALLDIRPEVACVLCEEGEREASPEEVEVGSEVIVRAGERIPLDGYIVSGSADIDTCALTGESLPRSVQSGDEVLGGCINLNGVLIICTTKRAEESAVAKILQLLENANSRKAKSEKFITKFARIYTPIVCAAAVALATIVPTVLSLTGNSADFGEWIYRALSFLVISCPCALVISVPLTFFATLGRAGSMGILIKGAGYIETLCTVRRVAFDKTGTLSEGSLTVSRVCAVGACEERLVEYAAYAELHSNHPIAEGIRKYYGKETEQNRLGELHESAGMGIRTSLDGRELLVGNARMMRAAGYEVAEADSVESAVHVMYDGCYIGCLFLTDTTKSEARGAITALRELGVEETVVLSGDRRESVNRLCREVEADAVYAELLPQDKTEVLERLMSDGKRTAFVGDGINDAPVLRMADVGIAMGGVGSDIAIEAADVVIMDDNLERLPVAISLSAKCMRIVRENIAVSLAAKGVCLLLVALGAAGMYLAIAADVGIMLLAVLNSLRMLMYKKNKKMQKTP